MPKGQYTRKPRPPVEAEMQQPERVVSDEKLAELNALAETAPARNAASLGLYRDAMKLANQRALVMAEPDNTYAEMVGPLPAEPKPESFDDWMDQPVPTAPNDTMVGQKVRTWAGSVCGISHGVTWAPVNDGSAIEVVLTTIHGTARMRKPAGQWTEADVDFALEAMRDDLKV